MLFKIITKLNFNTLVELLLQSNEVIAPKSIGTDKNGAPIHHYLPIDTFDEMDLTYTKAVYSAKTYFLPYNECLSSYDFKTDDWQQHIRYRIQPRAIIGLHACDINALVKLDKVLLKDYFPSPYYASRRRNTFIIGIDHEPAEDCFCRSLGEHTVTHGFDLYLTDLGDRYFVAIDSDRGYNALQEVENRDITDNDTTEYLKVRQRIRYAFKTRVSAQNLPNILDIEFESEVWKKWGEKCLSCGSCAMVCPTCYCYGVEERISMDFLEGRKIKKLYSCNLPDFAAVAGGHNFRPTSDVRLKYRYYHQHRGFSESYDEPKCVGCNRCGQVCLAGINPPAVIRDLLEEREL